MFGISGFRSEEARAHYCQLYDAALATTTVSVAESDIETSFGRTHVLRAGDSSKPPLVALHASSFSSTMWLPLLPAFTGSHSVTMIDVVDEAGKSRLAKPTTKSADLVAWLDETLRALDIRRSAIVAASRGGWIATHFASAFPERVDRLALVCPVGIVIGMSPGFLFSALRSLVQPTEERVKAIVDTVVMPSTRPSLQRLPWQPIVQQFVGGTVHFQMSLKNPQPRPWPLPSDCDLERIATARIPFMAIMGKQDLASDGTKAATRFRKLLPEARVELVDDANHMIFADQLPTLEKLLVEFLH